MVILANTIVDPLAVVVEATDALVTDVAVTGGVSACDLTLGTQVIGVDPLYKLNELNRGGALQ